MLDRGSLLVASIVFPVLVPVGLLAMREVPADPGPANVAGAAAPAVRFARVDVPTILRRSMFRDASIERQKEALARFAPRIEACDDDFRRVIDEAEADPDEKARETYSPPYVERFREIRRRVTALREEFRSELESVVSGHEAEAKRIAERTIAEIAAREGYTAVFTMPHDSGQHRWDPDEEEPFAPLAWCGTCDDLTLEVADAVGLPKEAFDPESDYWRIRGEVVLEIHGYLDRRPWEPPEE